MRSRKIRNERSYNGMAFYPQPFHGMKRKGRLYSNFWATTWQRDGPKTVDKDQQIQNPRTVRQIPTGMIGKR